MAIGWFRQVGRYRGFVAVGLVLALVVTACGAEDIADEPGDTDVADADAEGTEPAGTEPEGDDPEEPMEEDPGRTSVRWATADVGSYGYSVASFMVDFLNRELPEGHVVTVHPYPSTTAAMKAVMDGEADIGYTADVGMTEYLDRTGPYEGYEPGVGDLVHSFYAYPMENYMVTTPDLAGEYASVSDFDGEPVFFTVAGFMNWLNWGRTFDALGYEFNHVEIDSATVADALQAGTIVGTGGYTTAGASLPTYLREAELRTDLVAVPFSDEELDQLEAAGVATSSLDPEAAWSSDLGVDGELVGVVTSFGYNLRADADEDFVYQMLTIFEDNVESLTSLDPGFVPLSEDFVGLQVNGIRANPDHPVHAGLARFLEEHDAWNDEWTIAE